MNIPEDYESFCTHFKDEPQLQTVQFLRSWLINRQTDDKSGRDYSDFDELTSLLENSQKRDAISRIAAMTGEAFAHITASPHSEIIREDVLMPLYKVREVDGYCINWLSRRSGRTVREKLASTASMMGVRRRESLDTGENRLLKAFASRMADCIRLKMQHMPEYTTEAEIGFEQKADMLLRREDFEDVRRWENLPPNNTLLSDKDYSKIWRGWQELQELDDMLKGDCEQLAVRLRSYFTWRLLQEARKYFIFPQIPVKWKYADFHISVNGNSICGFDDATGDTLVFRWNDDAILTVVCGVQEYRLAFSSDRVEVEARGYGKLREFEFVADTLDHVVTALAKLLWHDDGTPCFYTNKKEKHGEYAAIDILAVKPRCALDDAPVEVLPFRLLRQKIGAYDVSSAFSDAVHCEPNGWEPYTLNRILADKNVTDKEERAAALLKLLNDHLDVKKLTLLFPDLYDDFQLSPVRRAARLYYADVRSLPKSVAAVFDRESRGRTAPEEAYVVVDKVSSKLSLTLIVGQDTDKNGKPLPRVVWERHPQEDSPLAQPRNLWELSYSASDPNGEDEDLKLNVGDAWHPVKFDISVRNVREDVEAFLAKRQKFVGGKTVRVLLLSPELECDGGWETERITADGCLNGARYCDRLSERLPAGAAYALWTDHLPDLAIKLLYDKFDLVKDFPVRPIVNQEVPIKITNIFTLPKGESEYHFQLVKSDGGEAMLYEAIVAHRVFPLDRETDCRLRMTYRYGSDNPYMLYFEPLDPAQAGFSSVEVKWERLKEYPFEGLPAPQFPEPPSWDALRHNPKKDKVTGQFTGGESDLFEWVMDTLNKGVRWNKILDFSKYAQSIEGDPGYRRIVVQDTDNQRFIILRENCFNGRVHFGDHLRKISVKLTQEKGENCYAAGLNWITNKNNERMALWDDEYGEGIPFYRNRFLYKNDYAQEPYDVFFIKRNNSRGTVADFIRTTNWPVYSVIGTVKDATEVSFRLLEEVFSKASVMYPLHTILSCGRNLQSKGCPKDFRDLIKKDIPCLITMMNQTSDNKIKENIIKILSLVTCSSIPDFYPIAYALLEQGERSLPLELGILLGDATTSEQQEILKRICALENPSRAMSFISRALWKNPDLIFNLPLDIVMTYFEAAVKAIEKGSYTLLALEYCLAVFRLRERGISKLNRSMSLNDPLIVRLRREVERRVKEVREKPSHEIRYVSRINFDEKTIEAAKNKKMPVFLYAMLMYITGDKGENEIKITEITEESE